MNRFSLKKERMFVISSVFAIAASVLPVSALDYEYWFDEQTQTKVSGTVADGGSFSLDISAADLTPGLHSLLVRVGDGKGEWSPVSASLFVRPFDEGTGDAAECEYWLDGDTRNRKRTVLSGTTSMLDIDASALSAGVHSIAFCAVDKEGRRGTVSSAYFVKPFIFSKGTNTLTAYRWWLDNGPEMATVEIEKGTIPYQNVIPFETKPKKLTRENAVVLGNDGDMPRFGTKSSFSMMFRDGNGTWGASRTDTFTISIPAAQTDLTEFIANHDATEGKKGWKWEGSIGLLIQDGSHWSGEKLPYFCMGNPSDNGFTTTMTQTVDGLPAGVYVLSAYGRANTEVTMTMSVGDNSVEFPAGVNWNKRSLVFATDGTPFEIKVMGTTTQRYQWFDISDFSLRLNCVGSLTVNFPQNVDMALYRNMRLTLEGEGRRLSKVVSESAKSYMFEGISASSDYTLRLLNSYGQTVASMVNVKLDKDAVVTLSDLKELVNPSVAIIDVEGNRVNAEVEWTDSIGNIFASGDSLCHVPVGEHMFCRVGLGNDAGRKYLEPEPIEIAADAMNPLTIVKLHQLERRDVSGEIYGNGQPLAGASVSVTEYVNGKYPNTITTRSGANGTVKLSMAADSCRINVLADGFADFTANLSVNESLGRIDMKQVTGATVSFDLSYSETSSTGPEASQFAVGLSDMNIVAKDKKGDSLEYSRQNGQIVLHNVGANENIELSVTSPACIFAPIVTEVKIDNNLCGRCRLDLVEPGRIDARYLSSQNKTDVAMVFDAKGTKVAVGEYVAQAVSFTGLTSGNYTMVSMNAELSRTDIPTMEALNATAFAEGTDYVLSAVEVNDGHIAEVIVGNIPQGTVSVRYAGAKSSFSSKKTTVTVGNFLTLTANIDFGKDVIGEMSGLSLVVDLPEDVEYITNSAMVGNHINEARLSDGRLIVPVDDSEIGSQIKFCVTPTQGGQIAIPASLEFRLGGEAVTEPLGSAGIEVENLKMTVPEVISMDKFMATGLAPAGADVVVTDGGVIIGETTARADGRWTAECTLPNPFHLTEHLILAKVKDAAGRKLSTDIHRLICDLTENEVEKVVMINTAHNSQSLRTCEYVTEFDFKEPADESPVYWYWPQYPSFTYKVIYTDNSPDKVKHSEVIVKTTDGNTRRVNTVYDPASDSWVGSTDFSNASSLPANVSVKSESSYDASKPMSAELMASVYAGVLTTDYKSNVVNTGVRILESVAENMIKFESKRDGKTASATMKFSAVDKIPDASTDSPDVVRLETQVEGAEPITILVDEEKDKIRIYSPFSVFEKISGPLGEIISRYNAAKEEMKEIKEGVEEVNDILKDQGIQLTEVDDFLSYLEFLDKVVDKTSEMNNDFLNYYALVKRYERLIGCEFVPSSYVDSRMRDLKRSFNIYFKVYGACSLGDWASDKIKNPLLGGSVKVVSKAGILASCTGKWISMKAASNDLMAFEQACGISDGKNRNSGCADAQHVIDPSGYVYEAVTSNRLPGVTATVYELLKEEDMYGDIHENPQKWDATAYSQRNPVVTDDNGVYAWDVPQGEWQVRFEKDGYEPASTGWLPVPPPQLEINIGMTHAVAPDAVSAKAFESGVVVTFDKYMEPGSFSDRSIQASVKGNKSEGKIVPENMETDPYTGRSYASEMKLSVDRAFTVGDSVDVIVGDKPRSYASMEMNGERRFRVAVLPEITGIAADSVISMDAGTSTLIPVTVSPATAASGKSIRVQSASPSIIVPSEELFPIDDNGIALVEVKALLPGSGILSFSIDNYTLECSTRVDADVVDENRVTMPTSSVPSGSVVVPGTTIALSTSTPDAIIKYTLDGTCPCLEGSRQEYKGPFTLTEDVVVKAQAFKDGLEPSEIAVFHYIIDNSGIGYLEASNVRVTVDGDMVHISAPLGSFFEIFDTAGLTVVSGKMTTDTENIHLSKGEVYFVHVATPTGHRRTVKIII